MGVNLAELRTRSLEHADMISGSFVGGATDGGDELRRYINASAAELHGILTLRFEDQFVDPSPTTFSLTGSANTYSLPSDFLKLRGLDYDVGGEWRPVHSFQWEERGRFTSGGAVTRRRLNRRYRIMGSSLYLVPATDCAGDYSFHYCPRFTKLVAETDELPDGMVQGGWDEYIVVDAAIKMGLKEETDVSGLMAQKRALIERVEREAANRDASEQETIADVYAEGNDWL